MLAASAQIAVEVGVDFVVDPLEVEVIPGILVALIHLPDAFGSVNDVEKNMSAAPATCHAIVADLEEEFGIVLAARPASLAVHGGWSHLGLSFSQGAGHAMNSAFAFGL